MRLLSARGVALLLTAIFVVYALILGDRVLLLLGTGRPELVVLGVAVLVFPLVGAILIYGEIQLGRESQRLGRKLADEGEPASAELPRRPSGRVDRAAADEVFAERAREAGEHPDDWRPLFRLARAYGDAGDSRRGRRVLRQAIALERQEREAGPPTGGPS